MACRICNNDNLIKFLSLGQTPLANSFLEKEDLNKKEDTYPLEVGFCPNCKLVQLYYVVPPGMMFTNYLYVSSTSDTFKLHFSKMAEELSNLMKLDVNSLAVDIGSNDGVLLKGFQKFGVRTVGVEPATNIAEIAKKNGIDTINDFFNDSVTDQILSSKGHADVITANNVFAHTDAIKRIIYNVKRLLKDDGIFVIEVAYLVDMLQKMTFDIIYHEHLFYYSLAPLDYLFNQQGMQIFDVQRIPTHGGSLRVFVKKLESSKPVEKSVSEILGKEKEMGIHELRIYENFANRVYEAKEQLVKLIKGLKNQGKAIAGYGAPAKSTTLLNFCGLGRGFIDYIVDENNLKQGLYTPGTHIPITPPSMLDKRRPDYILILAWNFAEEILNKTKKYKDDGIKFIIPLPEPVTV
ncbi:MAG: class I SAM-dependent methyltransferase [Candidatus Aenigmarchaeota archaeon]|nr:class I SAM-dependent methyltransferase [Candidatus Aenigmarchaeota archaeon]